jgi:DNA-binding NarL/FixJ family response regulator
LKLLHNGKTKGEIGIEVDLKQRTVEAFIDRLKSKTNTQSTESLIEFAYKNKLIDIPIPAVH